MSDITNIKNWSEVKLKRGWQWSWWPQHSEVQWTEAAYEGKEEEGGPEEGGGEEEGGGSSSSEAEGIGEGGQGDGQEKCK